jgi:hypothetical protein
LIARWPAKGAAWASSSVMAMAMAGASSASAVAALRRPVGQDVSHGGRGRHGDREQRRQSYRDRWQSCWTPEKRALPPAPRSGRVTPAPEEITTWPTGASEGPGGGRVRVRRDRYGTRRCGAPAPVVSAHARDRMCQLPIARPVGRHYHPDTRRRRPIVPFVRAASCGAGQGVVARSGSGAVEGYTVKADARRHQRPARQQLQTL